MFPDVDEDEDEAIRDAQEIRRWCRKALGLPTRPCGNDDCFCSTGICERTTHGRGRLDDYGYWEFPCVICARYFEARAIGLGLHKEHPEWFPYWPPGGTTVKCELAAAVCHPNALKKGEKPTTIAVLKFGPVVLGSTRYGGRWSEEQVLRDVRLNGVLRYKLVGDAEQIIRAQGLKV